MFVIYDIKANTPFGANNTEAAKAIYSILIKKFNIPKESRDDICCSFTGKLGEKIFVIDRFPKTQIFMSRSGFRAEERVKDLQKLLKSFD